MEIQPEQIEIESKGFWLWREITTQKTGKWVIKFRYDRGSMTTARVDFIRFNSEQEARYWFDHIYTNVFLEKAVVVTPPPLTPKKKPEPAKIIKKNTPKKNHLRLI